MHAIKEIFEAISIWIILLPLLIGSWFTKKLGRDSIIIFVLVIIATPPQILTAFLPLHSKTLNVFYNVYTPFEFFLVFILFKKKFEGRTNNIIFRASGILYLLISVLFITLFNFKKKFISEWACVNNIIYIVWGLLFISEILILDTDGVNKKNAFTYFLLGIFFYSQCTVLIFCLYYFISQTQILSNTWIIQSLSNIIMYCLFSIGFVVDIKSSQKHLSITH